MNESGPRYAGRFFAHGQEDVLRESVQRAFPFQGLIALMIAALARMLASKQER